MVLHAKNIGKLSMNISLCGDVSLTPKWNSENGYTPNTRLFLVYEGTGYIRTENETVWMKPGYAYLIPSKMKLAYGCQKLKKLFYMFRLTVPPEKEDILSTIGRILEAPYDASDLNAFRENFNSTKCADAALIHSLLYKYVFRILSDNGIEDISLTKHSELIKKAIRYIDSNAFANMTVRSISEQLFVSESKLRSTFRHETGISIGHYIDNVVMNKAKQMLGTQNLSVAQISAKLGYCDQFYFARQFKKKFGVSPSAYRKAEHTPAL